MGVSMILAAGLSFLGLGTKPPERLLAWPSVRRVTSETFERELAAWLGAPHVACAASGTTALTLAAMALGLRGRAVVPSFTFVATQAAVKHMVAGGRIITIGSVNAERLPFAGGGVYGMTKAAVAGLTRGLARDLGPLGITINNVQPGPTDTEMNPADGPFSAAMRGYTALGRFGTGDEIASLVEYLAGPGGGFVTGASINIDGGFAA